MQFKFKGTYITSSKFTIKDKDYFNITVVQTVPEEDFTYKNIIGEKITVNRYPAQIDENTIRNLRTLDHYTFTVTITSFKGETKLTITNVENIKQ